jgi:hypothetical protein
MKIKLSLVLATLLAVPAIAVAVDDVGCQSVNFGADVLAEFPNAVRACRGVKEKDGTVYARYVAKVVDTSKGNLTVVFEDKDGKGVSKVVFAPTGDAGLSMGGKDTKYSNLKKGDVIDMWVPHSRFGLYGTPGGPKLAVVSKENL